MGGGTARVRTFLWRHKAEGRSLVDAIKVPLTYSDHSSKSLRIQLKIDSFFIRAYNELTGQLLRRLPQQYTYRVFMLLKARPQLHLRSSRL